MRQPNYGGHIERLLGTFAQEIHSLPGTTFSRPEQRKGYDSEAHATFTLSEFEKWFGTLVVEVYHQRVHSAIASGATLALKCKNQTFPIRPQ